MRQTGIPRQPFVRRAHRPAPVAQPIPPIGGFKGVNSKGYSKGMPRQAAMLRGDLSPSLKLKIPKIKRPKLGGGGIMTAANSTAGRVIGGRGLPKMGRGPGIR